MGAQSLKHTGPLVKSLKESDVAQSCLTLCDPMDCSLPVSSVQGILLDWVAISFSRGSSQLRDRTWVSRIVGRCFTIWATREVHLICLFRFSDLKSSYRCFCLLNFSSGTMYLLAYVHSPNTVNSNRSWFLFPLVNLINPALGPTDLFIQLGSQTVWLIFWSPLFFLSLSLYFGKLFINPWKWWRWKDRKQWGYWPQGHTTTSPPVS